MKRLEKLLRVALVALTPGTALAQAPVAPEELAEAHRVIEASAAAYRAVPALADAFTYRVRMPGETEEKQEAISYVLGAGSDALMDLGAMKILQVGDRMIILRSSAPGQYVEAPIEGDFASTLDALMGGHANMPIPVQIEMRADKGIDVYAKALSFGVLTGLEIAGYQRIKRVDRQLDEVTFEGDNGQLIARFDPETKFLAEAQLEAIPAGAPPEAKMVGVGWFEPRILDDPESAVAFDPGSRAPVSTMAELTKAPVVVGSQAPDFTLATLDGVEISLSDLRGSVVVLDFWASWCALCRMGLPMLDSFATWAEERSVPVKVCAVNTMEEFEQDEKIAKAAQYWRENRLRIPSLLDLDDAVARAYGIRGLPMSFIIDPDGIVAKIQFRYEPGLEEILKAEVEQILARR